MNTRLRFLVAFLLTSVAVAAPEVAEGAVTKVYSSGEISEPIGPEIEPGLWQINAGSTIAVPDIGTVIDVKVRVRLDHPRDSEVHFSLTRPGTDDPIVTLASIAGGAGDNFGSGPGCNGTFTGFDDAASIPISAGTAPFAGTFKPEESLAAFRGMPANGEWDIFILDIFPGNTGRLLCWQIELTYEPPAPPEADLSLKAAGVPKTVTTGKKITYTARVTNTGPGAATGVVLTDQLPKGTTFLTAKASQGSCTQSGRRVQCALGDLPAGATASVTITVKAPAKPGRVASVATVDGQEDDPTPADARVEIRTTVKT